MKTIHNYCPHCEKQLEKSDNAEYVWQCKYCDEDFYDFEVKKETSND